LLLFRGPPDVIDSRALYSRLRHRLVFVPSEEEETHRSFFLSSFLFQVFFLTSEFGNFYTCDSLHHQPLSLTRFRPCLTSRSHPTFTLTTCNTPPPPPQGSWPFPRPFPPSLSALQDDNFSSSIHLDFSVQIVCALLILPFTLPGSDSRPRVSSAVPLPFFFFFLGHTSGLPTSFGTP